MVIARGFLATTIAVGVLLPGLAADHLNLTGKWVAELPAGAPRPGPGKFVEVIDHRDPSLDITRTIQAGPYGEQTQKLHYTTDGQERMNRTPLGDLISNTSWEGDTLVIRERLDAGGVIASSTRRIALSSDRQTMTVTTTNDEGGATGEMKLKKQ